MLRVAKIQSPMSVGAWVLVAFSNCVFFALLAHELLLRGYGGLLAVGLRFAYDLAVTPAELYTMRETVTQP